VLEVGCGNSVLPDGNLMTATNAGNFVWYDLLTSDPGAAIAFYEHVIGWSSRPMGADTGYTLFVSEQGPLGGAVQLPDQAKQMGAPPHWTSNVQVANVDATVAEAKRLGGRVYMEPSDYPNVGRLAIIADPQGAPINLFAPTREMRAHDATKPGEFVWHELLSADHEAAFAFYSKLFGWKKSSEFDMGAMGKYLLYGNGGPDLGGMFTKPKEVPVSVWIYYVHVSDLDAAFERAKGKGARVLNGPMEVPGGARIVQMADPQGAMFALHEDAKK
jgi:predicted enzyme related to lactoylglutathione lyase